MSMSLLDSEKGLYYFEFIILRVLRKNITCKTAAMSACEWTLLIPRYGISLRKHA